MIYDCILYNGEKECLDIRINELKGLNVCHVIVESIYTFSGKPKELKFKSKDFYGVNYVYGIITDKPDENPWENEKKQRNHIKKMLHDCRLNDDDVVIIADADEIPSYESVAAYADSGVGIMKLSMGNRGLYLNVAQGHVAWERANILRYGSLHDTTPDKIRNEGGITTEGTGWHFSWLGGVDKMVEKFESFSHQEPEVQKHGNPDILKAKYEKAESIWGDDAWMVIPVEYSYLPKYVVDNIDKFKHLIKA